MNEKQHRKAASFSPSTYAGRSRKLPVTHEAFFKKHFRFTAGKRIKYEKKEILDVLKNIKKLLIEEETLLTVNAPCIIVGDIHGQYDDLHRIFITTGRNGRSGATMNRFLFLGDYVDRGPQSLECICCLFAYKLAFPKMFNLLRGNHEIALVNQIYGFYDELKNRFTESDALNLWDAFNDVFDYLPLAAIIKGKILCMHGGLSPNLKSLDDIRKIKRPIRNITENPLVCDLLWADPMIGLNGFAANNIRGVSVFFGENVVLRLCNALKIDMIVRAHQTMTNGFGFFCKRKLVTIFSAPKYDVEKNNKGAIMKVSKHLKIGFILLHHVKPPKKGRKCLAFR
ncbi:unnamed protein product [Dracunculus medinensis]|uniref:Serine/threonine-protein phosphatase n=1 Tax=Dracunculus medinensis TaxID=318479 RepID=A0A0N4U6A3_DRAME|nr:unnamed protein product [Dracunculus medinensis]